MKHLDWFKNPWHNLPSPKGTIREFEDCLLEFIDDGLCTFEGNSAYAIFKFNSSQAFSDAKKRLNVFKLTNWYSITDRPEKSYYIQENTIYAYSTKIESYFINTFRHCAVKPLIGNRQTYIYFIDDKVLFFRDNAKKLLTIHQSLLLDLVKHSGINMGLILGFVNMWLWRNRLLLPTYVTDYRMLSDLNKYISQ